jgi:hypothetical protein
MTVAAFNRPVYQCVRIVRSGTSMVDPSRWQLPGTVKPHVRPAPVLRLSNLSAQRAACKESPTIACKTAMQSPFHCCRHPAWSVIIGLRRENRRRTGRLVTDWKMRPIYSGTQPCSRLRVGPRQPSGVIAMSDKQAKTSSKESAAKVEARTTTSLQREAG